MDRLAARRPALGLVELGDQRADRRDGAEPLQAAAQAVERLGADPGVVRDVAEGDDEPHVGALERAAEREVPHPAAVRRDPVADGSGSTSALIAAEASTASAIVSGGVSWDE